MQHVSPWFWGLFALWLAACENPSAVAAPRPSENVPGLPEAKAGTVTLPPESMQYVQVEAVAQDAQSAALELPARVIFREAAVSRVGTPVAGRVTDVHVEVGSKVRVGQALVTIRSPDAAAARSGLRSTEEALRVARHQAQRAGAMFEQGVATERERVEAELAVARLEAEAARARVTAQFMGSGHDGDVVIRAPMGGTVLSRGASVGAEVAPDSTTLMEIANPNAVFIQADVFERDLPLVAENAQVQIALESLSEAVPGHVVSVSASLDSVLRTAAVRIALDVDAGNVRPGMFGRVTILSGAPALTVPSPAVLIRNGVDTVVYVETGQGVFTRRAVQIGHSIGGRVQILSGLRPGERIVTRGALLLDGASDQLI